jgi:hypothetical protein
MTENLTSNYSCEYRGFERRTKDEWNERPDLATVGTNTHKMSLQ